MTESTDRPSDSPAAREVVARASHDGIAVRKVATMHGAEAVAVYFSIRSIRDDRCTVRIADAIPEALRGNEVEFHPKYDPVNWTESDGTVVYAAMIPPDANRTTVYGILVDDSSQLELFSAEPAVEVTDSGRGTSSSDAGSGEESFSFGAADEASTEGDDAAADRERSRETPPERAGTPEDDPDPVGSLVSELRQRDLADDEARAIREALGLEGLDGVNDELDSLREAVDSLRDEVASADGPAADVDQLESEVEALSTALDRRFASLSAELEDLETALDREARWRTQLTESLTNDPGRE